MHFLGVFVLAFLVHTVRVEPDCGQTDDRHETKEVCEGQARVYNKLPRQLPVEVPEHPLWVDLLHLKRGDQPQGYVG